MNAYQRIKWLYDCDQELADMAYSKGRNCEDYRSYQDSANAYQYCLKILIEEGLFDENGNSQVASGSSRGLSA